MNISYQYEIKQEEKFSSEKIISILLKDRQIKDKEEFLNPPSPLKINLSDFSYDFKKEIKKTVKILNKIKKNNQMIVVYTDYDADGITGGAILWETLYSLGFKVMPYVPHRKKEGYGFSIKGIDNVKKEFNPALIISVDHGITKVKEIAYARSLGIKIIVTDHHLKSEKIPKDASAIFYIPTKLSGAGIAYFFAKMVFEHFKSSTKNNQVLTANFSTDYLALASIGTVADLVPLVGPSRSLVKYGLEAFSKTKRLGLKHILKEAGIENRRISPYEIGFIIAPRINAVGRLEHAIDALRLLCTTCEDRAYSLAHKVGKKNIERQDMVEKALEEARKQLVAKYPDLRTPSYDEASVQEKDSFAGGGFAKRQTSDRISSKIIILTSETWHEGIIGLIAAKITEEFYRPTIVLTKVDDHYKGSARSIPNFHITNFLRSLKKYLIDVGGHAQAAGFTIEKDKITSFTTAAIKMVNKLIKDKNLERKIEVDLKIPISKINLSLAKALETLQPFGVGNPQPTFYSQVKIIDAKLFGKKNQHLKIFAQDPQTNSFPLELIGFDNADQFFKLSREKIIDVVYSLEINRWGGKNSLRGRLNQILIKHNSSTFLR